MSVKTTDLIQWGALRALVGFPLEHPLELVKLKAQSTPSVGITSVQDKI